MLQMGRRRTGNFNLPPRMHKKGDMHYYVTTTIPRKWIPLDKDLPRAKVMWAQIEAKDTTDRFSDALDAWISSEAYSELAPLTKKTYSSIVLQLRDFFKGASLDDITPAHVAQWLDCHPSKSQANTGKSIISKTFQLAIRRGLANTNPASEIKRHTIKARERYITHQEFKLIRENANEIVRIAMDLAYLTSTRIGDILKIKLADCTSDGLFIHQQKTGKRQLFKMTPELLEVIERARKMQRSVRGMHLLCNRKGAPYLYGTFNEYWIEARTKAGVQDAHFHDIRGKAATDAEDAGQDHQKLLGHASKAMSDKYLKKKKADRVEPLRKLL